MVIKYVLLFEMIVMLICLGVLYRNARVYNLRMQMIRDIFRFNDWAWRVEMYHEVSYDRMVLQFWKPVKPVSFYKDLSFWREENSYPQPMA